MANKAHVAMILRGPSPYASWNDWARFNSVTADLEGADLSVKTNPFLDFSGLSLKAANLREANLSGQILVGADLSEADLTGAVLDGATLDKCDLRGSILRGARIGRGQGMVERDFGADPAPMFTSWRDSLINSGAPWRVKQSGISRTNIYLPDPFIVEGLDVRSPSLSGAMLESADLRGAVITDADMTGAFLAGSHWGFSTLDANTAGVSGLDKTAHDGPTYLTQRVLRTMPHPIAESFVRGCGLSDWEIMAASLHEADIPAARLNDTLYQLFSKRLGAPIRFYSVFISYSYKDATFAEHLHEALQERGIRCWRDRREMLPGDDIYAQIDNAIRNWDMTVLCCSRHSLTSWWVDNEIDTAFQKERDLMRNRQQKVNTLIPLDLDGYLFSEEWQSGKRQAIRSRLAADFTNWEEPAAFSRELDRLLNALKAEGTARMPAPPSQL